MYELFALIGFIGLAALTALGFMGGDHHGDASGDGGHLGDVGDAGGLHHVGHTSGHHGVGPADIHHAPIADGALVATRRTLEPARRLIGCLPTSPTDIFALSLGWGAGGIAATNVAEPLRMAAAALGAILFQFAIAKPMLRFFMKFASKPSEGLAGLVAKSARAETRFDAQGRGIVLVELDGETVQLLARLQPDEHSRGVQVGRGENVLIVAADEARNGLIVSRDLGTNF